MKTDDEKSIRSALGDQTQHRKLMNCSSGCLLFGKPVQTEIAEPPYREVMAARFREGNS